MPTINFNQFEAEALAHLAEHYDQVGKYLDIKDFYQHDERGRDAVMDTITRFIRYELVKMYTRGTIEILPQAIDVVAQLRGEVPQPPTTVNYNVHGHNARVNVNSIDNSTNSVSIDRSVFKSLHEVINSRINDSAEQQLLLKLVAEMDESAGTPSFLDRYKEFMAAAANHMTVIAPMIPALTQMLG